MQITNKRRQKASCQKILQGLIAATACSSAPVIAAAPLSENDFLGQIPNVAAATRYTLPLSEAPASVTLITREMIDALPSVNFIDVLKLVPGFQVFFANGSISGVTSSGQSDRYPRRLEIRVDGRTVYTPINSSVSWESLGLTADDILSIEVVRGPAISVYGTNAAQGAININTRSPLEDSGTELSYTTGDWGTSNTSARYSNHWGNGAYTVRANYRENDGFKHLNDQSYVDSLALQGVYSTSLIDGLHWELGYSDGNFGFGDGDRPEEFEDENIDAQWLHLSWQRLINKHLFKLRGSASMGEYERSRLISLADELDLTPEEFALQYPLALNQSIETADGLRKYQQYDLEFEHQYELNSAHKVLWGLGFRHQVLKAPTEFSDNSNTENTTAFLFGNWAWQLRQQWNLHLGAMLEDHPSTDPKISPRLALNYHLNEEQHFRLAGSLAYRQPSLYERKRVLQTAWASGEVIDLVYTSDPNLGPEKFQNVELGYLGYWFRRRLSIDYRLYREYLDDGIDYVKYPYNDSNGKFRLLENAASYRLSGYEAQIQWQDHSWLISAQYANVRLKGIIDNVGPINTPLDARTPQHTSSLLISKRLPAQWYVSATAYHQSFVDWRAGTQIPSWHRYDLQIRKEWRLNKTAVSLALINQNVTEEEYLEYQQSNTMDNRTFVQLKMNFD